MIKFKISFLLFLFLFNWNLFSQTTLTHNIGNNVIPNLMYSCSGGGICWARKFELSNFGITSNQNFIISSGEVGLFHGINWDTNLQFNIYAVDSNFPASFSESSLIGSSQVVQIPMNININQIISVNFVNPILIPAGTETILVEVFQLSSLNSEAHAFVAGTEFDNDFSWFRSKNFGCPPYNAYVTTESLGRPDAKFYIIVNGQSTNIAPFNLSTLNNCSGLLYDFFLTNNSDISNVTWNFGDINSGNNNISTLVNPTHIFSSTGQYNVNATITNLSGEIYNINQIINVLSPPIANYVQPVYACENDNISGVANFDTNNIESSLLGNQTGMTILYFDNNGNSMQSPLPNPFISSTTSLTARISYLSDLNCYDETTISFISNPLPTSNVINDIYSCDSDSNGITSFNLSNVTSALLSGQSGMTIEIYDGNNQIFSNPLPNNYINVIPNQETITAKVINPFTNCTSQTTFNLIAYSTITPTITSPQTFCFQDNSTINDIVITGQNITWYNAQTAGNILPITTALQNGNTYYATQTINGCESERVSVTVNIQNTPTPTGNATQTFCSTQSATLNDISITGTDIIWYADNVSTTVLLNSTTLVNNTSYFATQTVNDCESSTRFEVLIDLINTLNAVDYQETLCDDLDDGSESINLTNFNNNFIGVTGNSFSYYNSLNAAENQISSAQINNVSNYNLNIGITTIFVRIDSQNGCHQIVELKLTLVSKPRIAISDIMPVCEGTSIIINAGNGFDSYDWSTGETTQSIIVSQAGNYSVTVTENHNGISCSSTKNFTVVNSNAATVTEIITSDWSDNNNTITVLLSNSSVGNYVYSLDGINYQSSNLFSGLDSGEYTVFIKDTNGCGISNQEIYLLMYPKYFTPNGDSYNDTWKIKFSQKEPNLKIAIFDRYGKLLKTMTSLDSWDGKFNGKDLPSDDYWFVVTRQNGKEFRGHFAMKR